MSTPVGSAQGRPLASLHHGPDLLQTILGATQRIVEVRREAEPLASLEARAMRRTPDGERFEAGLSAVGRVNVIAECKRRSPSRGVLAAGYDPVALARSYEAGGAAAISVLTEPTFFDGSLDHLRQVREAVEIPLLRKDFVVERYQILEAIASGADAVLLIVGAVTAADLRSLLAEAQRARVAALVEVHDAAELQVAVDAGAKAIGVNSRNLRTLSVDPRVHDELAPRMPKDAVAVAESGLREFADLQRLERTGYDAFLVGERLIAQPDPGAGLRALRGLACE